MNYKILKLNKKNKKKKIFLCRKFKMKMNKKFYIKIISKKKLLIYKNKKYKSYNVI